MVNYPFNRQTHPTGPPPIPDPLFFELKDEVSPGVFKTLESFVCVIMPVRLS